MMTRQMICVLAAATPGVLAFAEGPRARLRAPQEPEMRLVGHVTAGTLALEVRGPASTPGFVVFGERYPVGARTVDGIVSWLPFVTDPSGLASVSARGWVDQLAGFAQVVFAGTTGTALGPVVEIARGGGPQTLLFEDAEGNIPGWVFSNFGAGVGWRLALDGDCGSTGRIAFNRPDPACDYDAPNANGLLESPTFFLSGPPPYTFEFEYQLGLGKVDTVSIVLQDSPFVTTQIATEADLVQSAMFQHASFELPAGWQGSDVKLQFFFVGGNLDNMHLGFVLDNIVVTNGGGGVVQPL